MMAFQLPSLHAFPAPQNNMRGNCTFNETNPSWFRLLYIIFFLHLHHTLDTALCPSQLLSLSEVYLLKTKPKYHLVRWLQRLATWKGDKSISKNLFVKSSENNFIFSPAFYIIIWLMNPPKNFEKIFILKVWQQVSFWGVKTHFGTK